MKYDIRKKRNSSLWAVREWMHNGYVGHWVEIVWDSYDNCVAYVRAHS